ncbi:unnamed protein product [Gadus morhua 'NCC']
MNGRNLALDTADGQPVQLTASREKPAMTVAWKNWKTLAWTSDSPTSSAPPPPHVDTSCSSFSCFTDSSLSSTSSSTSTSASNTITSSSTISSFSTLYCGVGPSRP